MGLKLFGAKGIDQRKNYLTRDKSLLSDGINIRKTKNDEYSKRSGQEAYEESNPLMRTNFATAINSDRDFLAYKKNNSTFYCNGEDFFDSSRGFLKVWGYGFDLSEPVTVGRNIWAVDSLGCLIFTHYVNPTMTMKYDGKDVYYAGLPAPQPKDRVASGVGGFSLFYYSLIDNQGNQIDGPSTIVKSLTSFELDISELSGFRRTELLTQDNKVMSVTDRTIKIINDSFDDIQYLIVGDKIPVRSYGTAGSGIIVKKVGDVNPSSVTLMLEIESITNVSGGVSISFTEDSFKGHEITIANAALQKINFHCGLFLKQWFSYDEFTGYFSEAYSFLTNICFTNARWTSGQIDVVSYFGPVETQKFLSVEYDLTTSKLRPPVAKNLYMYGYQLVCGNVLGFWDFENNLNSYTNNDLIMYSDLNAGDTPESFSESNRQLIGETQDGEITALGRVNDSLIVFKNRGVHAIDGVLLPGQYSKRTISSKGVGCDSFKSVVETDGFMMFQSYDGIYMTNGYKLTEASEPFFELFNNIDTKKTRGANNPDFDEVLIYCKGKDGFKDYVFAFNYKEGGIYLWDSINANWGFYLNNNRDILIFGQRDDNLVLKLSPGLLRDVDQPINGMIRTSYIDGDEPGLLKKINSFRVYSFSNKGQSLDFKVLQDWNDQNIAVSSTIEEFQDPNVKTKNQSTGTFTAMSFALELSNNIIDEDLCISDYEIAVNINQSKDKNVK